MKNNKHTTKHHKREEFRKLGSATQDRIKTNYANNFCESVFSNPDQLSDENNLVWHPRFTEMDKEKLEILEEGLKLLTTRQKKVILLLSRGLTYKDVAVKLRMTKGAVQQHQIRARKKLLEFYKNYGE